MGAGVGARPTQAPGSEAEGGAGQQLREAPGLGAVTGASGKQSRGQLRCGGSLGW
jgi:hypothetical protein